jgi:hypothetical protein
VAQSRVSSPDDIYDALYADTTFMSYIGEYKFINSTVTQSAFSIVTPNIPIPNLEGVTGLEVVIHDVASVSRKDFITDPSLSLLTYQLYLILWTGGTGTQLTDATKRIVETFSGARSMLTVPINKTPNVAIQSTVEIPDNALILT